MRILLRPNLRKKNSAICTLQVAETLVKLGVTPLIDNTAAVYIPFDSSCERGEYSQLLASCDMVIAIGGDGTIMRTAAGAAETGVPMLGINTGNLGFLSQLESTEIDKLELIQRREYRIVNRMMLEAYLESPDGQGHREDAAYGMNGRFTALNDIVISSGDMDDIADIEVRQGGSEDRFISRQRGDGMIFSTPTGSTAYNLSAGGPIIAPDMELVTLTAICPHATFRGSIVLPAEHEYIVSEYSGERDGDLIVTADGKRKFKMASGDRLYVRKYAKHARFVDLGIKNYYESIGEKLSWRK